jgi:hypothetical protein
MMGLKSFIRAASAALITLVCSSIGLTQEGYPLDGTWRGQWHRPNGETTNVVIVMKWDGTTINGTLNPGPNSTPFASADLEPDTWTVRIEAEPAGGPIAIEGTLREIGSYNRFIEGVWRQGDSEYDFRITRE